MSVPAAVVWASTHRIYRQVFMSQARQFYRLGCVDKAEECIRLAREQNRHVVANLREARRAYN